jgi:PAS domain S-box-containing protein
VNAVTDLVRGTDEQLNGLFGAMVDALPVASYITDAEGHLKYFNPAAVKLSGRVPELGTDQWCVTWKLFRLDGTPLPHDQCPMAIALKGGEVPGGIECIAERPDGTRLWFTPYPVVLRDAQGKIIGGMNLLVDITDRKKAEVEAVEALRQLRLITDNMDVGVTRCTRDHRYLWVSPSLAVWLGRTPEEIAGRPILDVIGQEGYASILPHIQRVLSGEREEYEAEVKYRGIGVRRIHAVYVPTRGQDHEIDGWIAVITDVTERHQAEARLKNAERIANVGHWDWNLKSSQVIWSEGTFRIFGQPRDYKPSFEDLLRMTIPEDRERLNREVTSSLAEKHGFVIEFQIARLDGELRTVRSISEVSLDEEERAPVRMFGTVQDITDERRAQEESIAKQKWESLGRLASGVAHDFNNLLSSALAQAELASALLAEGSNPEEELRAIRAVASHGAEIVQQLMTYAGKENAAVSLVDVSRIVEEMVHLLKISVSKHAMLEVDLAKDLPAIPTNAAQIQQIVMNLVKNASEAIGDRTGVIRVFTKYLKARRDSSGELVDQMGDVDLILIEVSDTGSGMPPEMQAKVFDPFFTTKSTGHGLGLATVDGIVRSLRGKIHLASEPGKGTTFQIFLPCV